MVICGVVVEAVACIDDSAYSLSLVTYDKRFFGGSGGVVDRRVGVSLIIGYLL